MLLNIKDRFYFPQLLPKENSYMDFNLKKSILGKVAVTKEDIEKFGIKENPERRAVEWDSQLDADNPLKVDFTKEELAYLRKGCEALSDTPFPDDFWGVVEKVYSES